jgi:hypothetical protein
MENNWKITLDHLENRRKMAVIEGRAQLVGGREPEFEFMVSLFFDTLTLNLPATQEAQAFIAGFQKILGQPKMEPTIKCSCSWGDGVMGAMQMVMWGLSAADRQTMLTRLGRMLGIELAGLISTPHPNPLA